MDPCWACQLHHGGVRETQLQDHEDTSLSCAAITITVPKLVMASPGLLRAAGHNPQAGVWLITLLFPSCFRWPVIVVNMTASPSLIAQLHTSTPKTVYTVCYEKLPLHERQDTCCHNTCLGEVGGAAWPAATTTTTPRKPPDVHDMLIISDQ